MDVSLYNKHVRRQKRCLKKLGTEFPEAKYLGTQRLIMKNVLAVENAVNIASLVPTHLKKKKEKRYL